MFVLRSCQAGRVAAYRAAPKQFSPDGPVEDGDRPLGEALSVDCATGSTGRCFGKDATDR